MSSRSTSASDPSRASLMMRSSPSRDLEYNQHTRNPDDDDELMALDDRFNRRTCTPALKHKAWVVAAAITIVTLIAVVIGLVLRHNSSSSPTSSSSSASPFTARIIGQPIVLPSTGDYATFTILALNDVYELLPLKSTNRGGFERVATVRSMLLDEDANTLTLFGGDLVSPSALSSVTDADGKRWNGVQMIAAMNALQPDYAVFGNHEFDLDESSFRARVNESTFRWVTMNARASANAKLAQPGTLYADQRYVVRTLPNGVRLLIIGVMINSNQPSYVTIDNTTTTFAAIRGVITSLSGQYDVVVALTHWDIATDLELAESIPEIDLVVGGHDHENMYFRRGLRLSPVSKADSNAVSVYVHRFAFERNTKQLLVQSYLSVMDDYVPPDPAVHQVCQSWFDRAIALFQEQGYQPLETIANLPVSATLDGRSSIVRSSRNNLLSTLTCGALMWEATTGAPLSNQTAVNATIGLFNTGSIRIDDIISGGESVTQYDALRILPFPNAVTVVEVPGSIIYQATLRASGNVMGTGMFMYPCGALSYDVPTDTWRINNNLILSANTTETFLVATTTYITDNTPFKLAGNSSTRFTGRSHTMALIGQLRTSFP